MTTDVRYNARSLRIGAVGYLNSKPLVEGLSHFVQGASLQFDTPSQLAERMKSGEFDIGLIPVVEFLSWEKATYVGGLAVGSFGPVMSVCVHSRKPFDQIRSMALDEGSKTSIALMRILFKEHGWNAGITESFPLTKRPEDNFADALLLIGDRAMVQELKGYPYKMDLGEEWKRMTGLPFVYALWAVRPGLELTLDEIQGFHRALAAGKKKILEIAGREASRLGKDPGLCVKYLTQNIKYELDNKELEGLRLFQKKLENMGMIHGREIHEVDRLDSPGNG